jgi:hypothetical protein
MKYADFENTMSAARMSRYLTACSGDTKKAMTLYRLNLRLSQELFTVISCFEVALRNAIDKHYLSSLGNDWLKNAAIPGGIFDDPKCRIGTETINDLISKLKNYYVHSKLVSELGFGFWRYLFSPFQFRVAGQTLIAIFPSRPFSTPGVQYNASFVFNELARINNLRNRIAHHEPICFVPMQSVKNTTFVRQHYSLIRQLFQWMSIDEAALLYGLDHVNTICNQIDSL